MEKITRIESFIKLKTINWISLIFSTTLLFFSIPTYNIFPKISSDTPQLEKRNLEEKITENCLSAITSIEFIDYSNLTINYSEYKYLAIYRPFHKYEHKKRLSNGSYTYIYTNNSFEEGYESREVSNKNKKLYFFNNKIIRVNTTKFLIYEHYNSSNHSCIDGYKSCGKVSNKIFTSLCVPKDDECPIQSLENTYYENYTLFGNQNFKTVKFRNNSYFHYTQYDENKTITDLYLDFGIYCGLGKNDFYLNLFSITNGIIYSVYSYFEFLQFKYQNNIIEVYPNIGKNDRICLTAKVKNLDNINYSEMKCISDDSKNIEPNKDNSTDNNNTYNTNNTNNSNNTNNNNNNNTNNNNNNNTNNNDNSNDNMISNNNNYNSPNNNQNTNPSSIKIYYGNDNKDPSFIYNNSSLVDFRNKMKEKFETALFLSVIFNLICIIFIVFEILIMKKLDYEDDTIIFFLFLILRLIHFILNLIILIYEICLLAKYNFNIERILFIKFSKLIHLIYIILCLIILSLDVISFYYLLTLFNSFRKLKKEYLEVKKDSTITQNESSNYENKNSTDLKIRNNDSNNIVPSPAQFNQVPTTVINMNPYNN